jgi:hypothetical protein
VLPVRVNSKTSDQNVPVFAVHFLLKPVKLSLSLPFWAFLGSEATCGLVECEANYLDLRHRYLGPYWPVFNVIQVEGALQPLGTQHHRQLGHTVSLKPASKLGIEELSSATSMETTSLSFLPPS